MFIRAQQVSSSFLGLIQLVQVLLVYNVSSLKRLAKFLRFLQVEIRNISTHPHYQELVDLSKGQTIQWKKDFGQTIEKIVHILVDTHVVPCTKEKCFAFELSINFSNRWTAYSIDSCAKCDSHPPKRSRLNQILNDATPSLQALRLAETKMKGPKEIWHLEYFDTWIPESYSKLGISTILNVPNNYVALSFLGHNASGLRKLSSRRRQRKVN